jgi:VIT1/CCC1 family predicted Fe2+/Mn2+ transporter
MNKPLLAGLGFGLTSAVITTLGLMIGLNASTGSKLAVIGGILTIAVADAFSDALGVHVAKETEDGAVAKEVWAATGFTFLFKFIFALTFIIPVLLLSLNVAIIVSIVWGLSILSILSFCLAKNQGQSRFESLSEHLGVAILVLLISNTVGHYIAHYFG